MALSNLVKVVNPNATIPTTPTPQVSNPTPRVYRPRKPQSVEEPMAQPAENQFEQIQSAPPLASLFVSEFIDGGRTLRKCELWFGGPGTGKTSLARRVCQRFKDSKVIEDFVVINCHEEMTVMTTLKTTKTDELGNWIFKLNRIFNMLTDSLQKSYVIVFDEFNTASMSVMKAFQPWFDDTQGDFDFEEKTYTKNPNVNFVFTMNHEDIGISQIPKAVLDRAFPEEFESLTIEELSRRSGVPVRFIELLGKIHKMFAHLGDLAGFDDSVRKLKMMKGLTKTQFKKYITSELSLAHIEWKEAVAISPEFQNLIDEFGRIVW